MMIIETAIAGRTPAPSSDTEILETIASDIVRHLREREVELSADAVVAVVYSARDNAFLIKVLKRKRLTLKKLRQAFSDVMSQPASEVLGIPAYWLVWSRTGEETPNVLPMPLVPVGRA